MCIESCSFLFYPIKYVQNLDQLSFATEIQI
jgi:hypothetical protein